MERLLEKIALAEKALGKLAEAADIEKPSELERDATIQRFEFSFEAVWKTAQAYLRVVEGLDIASPKGVIRSCRELGLLTEAETAQCLKMAEALLLINGLLTTWLQVQMLQPLVLSRLTVTRFMWQ